MQLRNFFAAFIFSFLYSCSIDGTSWDIDGLAPVVETTFTLQDAIGNTVLQENPDSALILNYQDTLSLFDLDSLIAIPDTMYAYDIKWTLPNFTIPPGSTLPAFPFKLEFGIGNRADLTSAIISSGEINVKIKSVIPRKVSVQYTIPKATLNGVPFTITETIPAATPGDTTFFTKTIDLSGYLLDLKGVNANEVNVLYIYLTPTFDPNGDPYPITNQQFLFKAENRLNEIQPAFVQGKFKSVNEQINSELLSTQLSSFIKGGWINLDSIRLQLKFINSLGLDMRFRILQLQSVSEIYQNTLSLSHPSIGQFINLERPQHIPNSIPPVIPSQYSMVFNSGNSNIEQLVENLPDRFNLSAQLQLNPNSQVQSANDFIYTSYPPKITLSVSTPLRASVQNISFIDTLENPVFNEIQIDRFLDGELKLQVENKFPLGAEIQLYTVSESGVITDSLITQNIVSPAPVNAQNRVVTSLFSTLNFPFELNKAYHIKNASHIIIKAKFNTSPSMQLLQMYSDYFLRIKLKADIKYRIQL
jgi:hypothetical protein